MSEMNEQTPSQAEGERDDDIEREVTRGLSADRPGRATPRTTPSQAEGDRGDERDESG
ncbi:hypothetical protein FHS42_006834 [Streptomyces zagrosensis]|uniref:Uncharacterized protein n=1 Tax=Streptomyces zagrosensis TaxID=1042984 RepID=A0A7W9V1X0_9ACTN|nr:hypothetical protein [Streptomyces zagrosensis]